MKKLLSLLGSLTLASSVSSLTIACNKYDQKTSNGDSILVNFLQNLGVDQKTQLDANDILLKIINQSESSNRQSFVNDLTNLLDISILANAKSVYDDKSNENSDGFNTNSQFYNTNLKQSMQDAFSSINDAADSQISREKAKYQSDYGWKWKSKWKNYLAGKFPLYQSSSSNADTGFLEKKYKANLLLTSSDYSASSTLEKIILNTDQFGVTWIAPDEIKNYVNELATVNDKDAWINQNSVLAAEIYNSQHEYNANDDSTKWITPSEVNAHLDEIKNVTVDKAIAKVPSDISKYTGSDATSRSGFLSNSQKYIIEKWYSIKAPLATSFAKFSFASGQTFDNGISADSFKGPNNTLALEISHFITNVFGAYTPDSDTGVGDVEKIWKSLVANSDSAKNQYPDVTLTKNTDLTTLNTDSSAQDFATPLYDYVDSKLNLNDENLASGVNNNEINKNWSLISDLASVTSDTAGDTLYKLLYYANRDADGKMAPPDGVAPPNAPNPSSFNMYQEIVPGFIMIITSDGLYFYSVDGFQQLMASNSYDDDKKTEKPSKLIDDDGKIDSNTLIQLQAFNKFNNETNNEKIQDIQVTGESTLQPLPDDSSSWTMYDTLNNDVANPYLKWLLNNSLVSSYSNSATGFDVLKTVQTWATQSDNPSSSTDYQWVTYILDYFKDTTLSKDNKVISKYSDFINIFLTFGASNNSNEANETATKIGDWYATSLETIESIIVSNSSENFITNHSTWVDNILKTTAQNEPKSIIEKNHFNIDTLSKFVSNHWWISNSQSGEDK